MPNFPELQNSQPANLIPRAVPQGDSVGADMQAAACKCSKILVDIV